MTAFRSAVALLAVWSLALAGCHSVGSPGMMASLFGGEEKPSAAEPSSTYQVIFVPKEGQPEQIQRTLSGQMHIQEALEQVGAAKKFRRIQVELVRPLPSGQFHRIPLDYDLGTKQLTPEFDYALLPGDRIIVKEDPSTIVDDMLQSALGPLGTKVANKVRGRESTDSRYQIQR